jgi:Mor family transcriptional regulator
VGTAVDEAAHDIGLYDRTDLIPLDALETFFLEQLD